MIWIANPHDAVKGSYLVDAVFSAPGVFTWSLGLNLTVTDSCSLSTFISGPSLSPNPMTYYLGQGT